MGVTPDTTVSPADDAVEREVQRAWASLMSRADAIADDITLALLEQEQDFYDAAGPQMRAEMRISTREHIRRGIATMAGIAPPAEHAVHVWRETGGRRARQGVPLEMVLRAYNLGTRALWEALLDQRDNPEHGITDRVLLVAGQQIWGSLELQNATVIEAYRRESALLQRRDLQRQGRVMDALVEGRGSDPAFAAECKDTLGFDVGEPLACVVAPFDGLLDNPLRNPEGRLEKDGILSCWHVRGDAYFGLVQLGSRSTDELAALLRPCAAGRVGIAPAPEGAAGFPTAFQLALGTADTLPRGAPEVARVEQRLPEVLLAASPAATALLVHETLGGVLAQPEHHATVLLATLRALLAHHGSPTHAASALYCHRNTVIYRMRQLTELTGRDLTDARDRLMLGLALLALDT